MHAASGSCLQQKGGSVQTKETALRCSSQAQIRTKPPPCNLRYQSGSGTVRRRRRKNDVAAATSPATWIPFLHRSVTGFLHNSLTPSASEESCKTSSESSPPIAAALRRISDQTFTGDSRTGALYKLRVIESFEDQNQSDWSPWMTNM